MKSIKQYVLYKPSGRLFMNEKAVWLTGFRSNWGEQLKQAKPYLTIISRS